MPEALVAMPVARAPLEERADVEDAVAPPREHGHAVVAPLHTPTGLPTLAVVGAPIHPPIAHPQQARELSPAAGKPPRAPGPHRTRGPGMRRLARAQIRQVFPPVVSRLARGRVGEDPREPLPRRRRAIRRPLAKWPQRSVALGVLGWPTPSEPRNRVGRSATQTGTSNQGRWRRRTTASRPCRSRISRPQWRHRVPSRVLSTWMSQCPWSVLCMERTRPSGPCSGTCRLVSIAPLTVHRCRDHLTRVLPRSMRPVAHHGSSGRALFRA
jgi:hypothetical protein